MNTSSTTKPFDYYLAYDGEKGHSKYIEDNLKKIFNSTTSALILDSSEDTGYSKRDKTLVDSFKMFRKKDENFINIIVNMMNGKIYKFSTLELLDFFETDAPFEIPEGKKMYRSNKTFSYEPVDMKELNDVRRGLKGHLTDIAEQTHFYLTNNPNKIDDFSSGLDVISDDNDIPF